MNHLEYYYECIETGELKGEERLFYTYRNGLCSEPAIDQELLELFRPTEKDCKKYNVSSNGYWATDNKRADVGVEFGPTRQNIVLFIACMRNELI